MISNVELCGELSVFSIEKVEISQKANAYARGHIAIRNKIEMSYDDILKSINQRRIILAKMDNHQIKNILFMGYYDEFSIRQEIDCFFIEFDFFGYAKKMETIKKNRSFQNSNMTFQEVLDVVEQDISNSKIEVIQDTSIGTLLIQYEEDDWTFLGRVAGRMRHPIFCDATIDYPMVQIGIQEKDAKVDIIGEYYKTGIDEMYHLLGGADAGLQRFDYTFFDIKTDTILSLGMMVTFHQEQLVVLEMSLEYSNGQGDITYRLGRNGLLMHSTVSNMLFCGMSLSGEVIATEKETVKVKLDIDNSQDINTAYSFEWTPLSGNLMYCPPQVGTKVAVYLGDNNEFSGKAVSCIRTNGEDCEGMKDCSKRGLSTEHGKNLKMQPDVLSIDNGEKGQFISLLDSGMSIGSNKSICIIAGQNININSAELNVLSEGELIIEQTGGEVTMESATSPVASVDVNNNQDLYGEKTIVITTGPADTYDPFDDAPNEIDQEQLKNEILKNVFWGLAAVAVAVVCIALVVTTPAVLIAAAVVGTIAVVATAVEDWNSGNVRSTEEYMIKGVAGAFTGAACALLAPEWGATSSASLGTYLFASAAAGAVSSGLGKWMEMGLLEINGIYDYSRQDYLVDGAWAALAGLVGGAIGGLIGYGFTKAFQHMVGMDWMREKDAIKYLAGKGIKPSTWLSDGFKNFVDAYPGAAEGNWDKFVYLFRTNPFPFLRANPVSTALFAELISSTESPAVLTYLYRILKEAYENDHNPYNRAFEAVQY